MGATADVSATAIAVAVVACGFDVAGSDDSSTGSTGSSSGVETSSSDSTTNASGTTSTGTAGTGSTGPSGTSGATTTTAETGSTGPGSGTAVETCDDPPFFVDVILAGEAQLFAGMMTSDDPAVGTYAYSDAAQTGIATFQFDVPCDDVYYIWGLVHDADRQPFSDGGNADAYSVSVDLGTDFSWSYGCQTLFQVNPWAYERVQVADVLDCAGEAARVFNLGAGVHEVSVENIESGSFDDPLPGTTAAIARVVITNDPDYEPDIDVD